MEGLFVAHTKLITPGSQRFGEAMSQIVKISNSHRLRGDDLTEFVKRAGHQFVDALRNVTFHPGEVPIHMIAIGATEAYGPNRNGDGFKEACLRKYHNTFTKFARWYRNHSNKDPQKSYGIVKLSAYNERMRRVELIVALNGTKEAAARNGGLVADQELEKLAKEDDDFGVSMACRVPFDVCSGCHNQARHRGEYCTAQTCKYGGLMHNITKVAADGHVLHADNPDPTYFDISKVYRPADRIAFVLGHAKAASGYVKSGSALAEEAGVGFPFEVLTHGMAPVVATQIKLAYELAEIEERIHKDPVSFVGNTNRAFDPSLQPPVEGAAQFAKLAELRAQAWNALAGQKVMLPVRDFLCVSLGEEHDKVASLAERVARHLPGVYGRLIADENLESVIAANPYQADRGVASSNTQRWAEKAAKAYSVSESHVTRRVMQSALRDLPTPSLKSIEKQASDGRAEELARQYALYKLAMLSYWRGCPTLSRMQDLAIRQHYIRG
jgi:hypothetical protein